ncbi:MAG: hypothetical protein MJD61_07660 [Proteobacteria bacterium]|nr:hypothetical protein [Pseudomonadota bacterium]
MVEHSSFTAGLALILWVPVSYLAYARYRPAKAACLLALGATMLLPERMEFDPPLLPPFNKHTVSASASLLSCLILRRGALRFRPGGIVWTTIALLVIGALGTALTNSNPIFTGGERRPGLTFHDAIGMVVSDTLRVFTPFVLGASLVRTRNDLRFLMRAFAMAGLLYSLLMLVEIRLSPQLHTWVYGFHQHSFAQAMRGEGFRPTVFMQHGLAVALFTVLAIVASTSWARVNPALWRIPSKLVPPYLLTVLILAKSLAATVYAAIFLPLVAFLHPKRQLLVAALLVSFVLAYPLLRLSGSIDTQRILAAVGSFADADRLGSLQFRFANEDILLGIASRRLLFGWGGYGRSRFSTVEKQRVVTDGHWIIVLGSRGLFGYYGGMGLLALPVLFAFARRKLRRDPCDSILLGSIATMLGVIMLDLLPNGMLFDLGYFLAGALLTCCRTLAGAKEGGTRNLAS